MAVVTVVHGAGSPGSTTSTVALAASWPAQVVLADCDPLGGDLALGWCRPRFGGGVLDPDVGVASFVQATRRGGAATAEGLAPHLQTPALAPHVGVLLGVQALQGELRVDETGWRQVAAALVDTTGSPASAAPPAGESASVDSKCAGPAGRDVLVDCGRLGPLAPWPVLESADLVLVAAGSGRRQLLGACSACAELGERIPPRRVALLVCATDAVGTARLIEASGLLPAAELPADRAAAALLLGEGGWSWRRFEHTKLGRAARRVSRRLYRRLHVHYRVDADVGLGYPHAGGAA